MPKKLQKKSDWEIYAEEEGIKSVDAYNLLFKNYKYIGDGKIAYVPWAIALEAIRIAERND